MRHGLSTEPVPVSAYVGSSKNLKDLKADTHGMSPLPGGDTRFSSREDTHGEEEEHLDSLDENLGETHPETLHPEQRGVLLAEVRVLAKVLALLALPVAETFGFRVEGSGFRICGLGLIV